MKDKHRISSKKKGSKRKKKKCANGFEIEESQIFIGMKCVQH